MSASCTTCGRTGARSYERYFFPVVGTAVEPEQWHLCARCAREKRRALSAEAAPVDPPRLSRKTFLAEMERFWETSGAGEICRRCHEQGTGCCPPMCRNLSAAGCRQKNVFCTSFVCSALLNAISECDPESGRLLKWIKTNPGAAEFRVYEMVTRVPPIDREPVRPLAVPACYPGPFPLEGRQLGEKLLALAPEILLIRRGWKVVEQGAAGEKKAGGA